MLLLHSPILVLLFLVFNLSNKVHPPFQTLDPPLGHVQCGIKTHCLIFLYTHFLIWIHGDMPLVGGFRQAGKYVHRKFKCFDETLERFMVSGKNVSLAFPWLNMFRKLPIMLLSKKILPICSKLCYQNKD